MKIAEMKQEILDLLSEANPKACVVDGDKDMFSSDCGVAPRDLFYVCMELKKKYPIDFNLIVDELQKYSLNQFAESICSQLDS